MTTPQHQIRENTLELQDFVKGLHEWEGDVRKKDRKLIKGNAGATWTENCGENCPPVRGVTKHNAKEAPESLRKPAPQFSGGGNKSKPLPPMSQNKSPAAHTYKNYSQWDKFDLDAALNECDQPTKSTQESPPQKIEPTPPPPNEPPPDMKRTANKVLPAQSVRPSKRNPVEKNSIPTDANGWRQEGNGHFKIGDFQEAAECYTRSIECEGTSLGYANRAMARLKMGEHRGAEGDCTEAISLDPMYLKAYQRRSASREALGNLQGAVEDLEMVVRLGPTSEASKKSLLEGLNRLTRSEKLKPVKRRGEVPIQFPKKGKAQDRRGKSVGEIEAVEENDKEGLGSTMVQPIESDVVVQEGVEGGTLQRKEVAPVLKDGASVDKPEGATAMVGSKRMEPKVESGRKPPRRLDLADSAPMGCETSGSQSRGSSQHSTPRSANKLPLKGPKTGAEFETYWKGLREATLDEKSLYLSRVDPGDFQKIFKAVLSPPVMLGIVRCSLSELQKGKDSVCDVGHWISVLEALTKVPRFSMVVMCVGKKEKLELGKVWDDVCGGLVEGAGAKTRLENVRKPFGW
ncbi:hypothetical protein BSKO_09293 [Bryopsis sp. KO-2023]|nr:hypothetical protein BSKO_09293 [Bryopsis sp. KO-2023]